MPRKAEGEGVSAPRPGPMLHKQAMAWAIVLLRVFVGLKFLQVGISEWGWLGTNGFARQLTQWAYGANPAALSSYLGVLRNILLPHASAFAYVWVLGEILVGICLVLGCLTRAMTLFALLMSMHSLLATWNLGAEWQGAHEAFVVMELALLLTGAGRFCGVDVNLARKRPQWPFW